MSYLNSLVKIILNGNPYCCLCLKSLEEPAVLVQDEIFLENRSNSLDMWKLLTLILNTETLYSLTPSSAICGQCKKCAIESFLFIEMCEENSNKLRKTVDGIFNSLVLTNSNKYKTMYLSINENGVACEPYYNVERLATSQKTALKRFKVDIKSIDDIYSSMMKSEMEELVDDIDTSDMYKPKKIKKVKKPSLKAAIPTSEMMFQNNKLMCKVCHKSYASQQHLRQHFFRVHAPKSFQCEECSRSYGTKGLLDQHRYDSHTSAVCSECGKTYKNRYSLKMHELGHKTKVICTDCGRTYKHRKTYARHLELNICQQKKRKSAFEGKYVCDNCGKRFSHKSTLRVHIQFEHGTGKAHTCPWCSKRFFAQSRLQAHIVKHTQEKKFTCELCGGKFVTKESLLYHTRIHTGERPYECHLCDHRFLSTSRRTEHMRRHHMTASYECDICNSKFKERAWLLKHKKRHLNPKSRLHCSEYATEINS